MKRIFRGATYNIEAKVVSRESDRKLIVDGKVLNTNIIPVFKDKKQHSVVAYIEKGTDPFYE